MYNVWSFVSEVDELALHFLDLNHSLLPDRRFKLSILRINDLKKMISNERKYRANEEDEKKDDGFFISAKEYLRNQKCNDSLI